MVQLQFLNKILASGDFTNVKLNNIDRSYFSDYSDEFEFIRKHYEKYNQVPDKHTFLNQFPDFDLIEVKETDRYLVDALTEDKNTHIMAYCFNQVRDAINNGDISKATQIYNSISEKLVKGRTIEAVDIFHDTSRYSMYMDKMNDYNKHFITTGFKELDDILGGWDRNEDVITVAARTGVGKTWFSIKTATAAAQAGFRVGYYSGEMSESAVGYRSDTIMSHIANFDMLHGSQGIEVEYKKFLNTLNAGDQHLWVLTPEKIGGFATVNDLELFVDKYKLDILIIDQYSLMEDARHAKQTNEQIANISKDVKQLQVKKRIPVICVAQQNRSDSSQADGHSTTQIGLSDRVGQDSSVVIFLDLHDGISTIELCKARNVAAGKKLKYTTDLNKGVWSYIPCDVDALNGAGTQALRDEFEIAEGEEVF